MSIDDLDPHSQAVEALREGRPIEAQYVRQGKRNMRIVWVLVISLGLAALFTFGIWALNAPRLSGPGSQTTVSGRSFQSGTQPIQKTQQDATAKARGSTDNNQTPAQ